MPRKSYDQIPHDDVLLIRRHRMACGLTLDQLAEQIDTTRQHLQRMETGKRSVSIEWLMKIAHVLGVPPAALIAGGDGLDDDERELIEYLRAHPLARRVILSTLDGLRQGGGAGEHDQGRTSAA